MSVDSKTHAVLALFLTAGVVVLTACSRDGGGAGAAMISVPGIPDNPSTAPPPQDSTTREVAQAISQTPVSLTGTSLDAVRRTVTAGRIATAVIRQASGMLTDPGTPTGVSLDISACPTNSSGLDANRMTYNVFEAGHPLPAGKNLNIVLDNCSIEDVVVSGLMDISGIAVTGDPGSGQDGWRVDGVVSLSGLVIHPGNGNDTTLSNLSNEFGYSAELSNGVLTTVLDIASANVERDNSAAEWFNHLLEPFYIVIREDRNSVRYSIAVRNSPSLGPSLVTRYTADALGAGQGTDNQLLREGGIELEVLADVQPIAWSSTHPNLYADTPVGGRMFLSEPEGPARITVAVQGTGDEVVLTIDDGVTVTTQVITWSELLAAQ